MPENNLESIKAAIRRAEQQSGLGARLSDDELAQYVMGESQRTIPGLARLVGNYLHVNPDPQRYPCYKVVNHQGKLAKNFGFGGAAVQKERLEADGVEVSDDYRVDLSKYQWKED